MKSYNKLDCNIRKFRVNNKDKVDEIFEAFENFPNKNHNKTMVLIEFYSTAHDFDYLLQLRMIKSFYSHPFYN